MRSGSAQAQIKFASFGTPTNDSAAAKDITFQDARDRADLKHGTLVALQLNDGTKVLGHVVRFDDKANKLFIRTKAGHAAVAYGENDIKKLAKATRQVDANSVVSIGYAGDEWRDLGNGLQENANGVVRIRPKTWNMPIKPAALNRQDENRIKPAIDESNTVTRNVVEPEIIKQVGYNGSQRSVVYISNTISPGEREVLEQLQKAENDLMALSYQQELREAAIAQEMSLGQQRLRTQRLVNDTIQDENNVNYPYPPALPETVDLIASRRPQGRHYRRAAGYTAHCRDSRPYSAGRSASRRQGTRGAYPAIARNAVYEDGQLVAVVAK